MQILYQTTNLLEEVQSMHQSGLFTRLTNGVLDASWPNTSVRTKAGYPIRFLVHHCWCFLTVRSKWWSQSKFRIKYSRLWGLSWQHSFQEDSFPNHGNEGGKSLKSTTGLKCVLILLTTSDVMIDRWGPDQCMFWRHPLNSRQCTSPMKSEAKLA